MKVASPRLRGGVSGIHLGWNSLGLKFGMNNNRLWAFKLFIWLLLLLLFLVLIVLPSLTTILSATGNLPRGYSKYLVAIEKTQFLAMSVFTIVWIFFLGSCFASFLNVVAWRVPRGRSILGSSHCPFCNIELTFKNNIPIVGWIKNGGQCANCKLPISPRYLVAEIVLGSLFLFLALIQLSTGGANLPFRPIDPYVGFEHLLFAPKWDLIRLVFFHLVLVSTLFTFALIEFDRLFVPRSIFLFSSIVACGIAIAWPSTLLIDWQTNYIAPSHSNAHGIAAVTILAGTLRGYFVGQALRWVINKRASASSATHSSPSSNLSEESAEVVSELPILSQNLSTDSVEPDPESESSRANFAGNHILISLTLIGVFLGWQSVLSITIIFLATTIVATTILAALRRRFRGFGCCDSENATLLFAVMVHLASWRIQSLLPFWHTDQSNLTTLLIGSSLTFALLMLHQQMSSPNEKISTSPPNDDGAEPQS